MGDEIKNGQKVKPEEMLSDEQRDLAQDQEVNATNEANVVKRKAVLETYLEKGEIFKKRVDDFLSGGKDYDYSGGAEYSSDEYQMSDYRQIFLTMLEKANIEPEKLEEFLDLISSPDLDYSCVDSKDEHSWTQVEFTPEMQEKLKRIFEIGVLKDTSVLEVGCSTGGFGKFLSRLGADVALIDPLLSSYWGLDKEMGSGRIKDFDSYNSEILDYFGNAVCSREYPIRREHWGLFQYLTYRGISNPNQGKFLALPMKITDSLIDYGDLSKALSGGFDVYNFPDGFIPEEVVKESVAEQYDIVLTKRVFESGSGAEAGSSGGRSVMFENLIKFLARRTKQGGYCINEGGAIASGPIFETDRLKRVGLDLVETREGMMEAGQTSSEWKTSVAEKS